MSIFCFKNLEENTPLGGEYFKKIREKMGISLKDISASTHLPLNYLEAIENNQLHSLPFSSGYLSAYINKYAHALNINPKTAKFHFQTNGSLPSHSAGYSQNYFSKALSVSLLLKKILLGGSILLFIFYLGWQVKGILQPPRLVIHFPSEGYITNKMNILIQGETEKEAQLTINGQIARINERGQFELPLDLSNGINTINIVATKKHGKTTAITRRVVAQFN